MSVERERPFQNQNEADMPKEADAEGSNESTEQVSIEVSEPEKFAIMQLVNERLNELIRKEQGWDVKTQSKSNEPGLEDTEKQELKKLSGLFGKLGGRDAYHELREKFKK